MEGCGDNFRKQVDEVEVDEGGKDGETRSKAEAKCRVARIAEARIALGGQRDDASG